VFVFQKAVKMKVLLSLQGNNCALSMEQVTLQTPNLLQRMVHIILCYFKVDGCHVIFFFNASVRNSRDLPHQLQWLHSMRFIMAFDQLEAYCSFRFCSVHECVPTYFCVVKPSSATCLCSIIHICASNAVCYC
jgi:hypothetical protein